VVSERPHVEELTQRGIMALVYCRECGKQVSDQAPTCPNCGAPQRAAPIAGARPVKSRGAAIILALLLGGIGAHKFYLDRPLQGLLYLVFCLTFVPAIIAFLEAIAYALTSEAEFHKTYG